jgi:hypothetical protein
MHTLYFVGHFIGFPTCFDPYGSSSGHLIHWTSLGCYIYYIIHISSCNGLWLSQVKSVLRVQSGCYYRRWNIILVSCVRLGWIVVSDWLTDWVVRLWRHAVPYKIKCAFVGYKSYYHKNARSNTYQRLSWSIYVPRKGFECAKNRFVNSWTGREPLGI